MIKAKFKDNPVAQKVFKKYLKSVRQGYADIIITEKIIRKQKWIYIEAYITMRSEALEQELQKIIRYQESVDLLERL